MEMLGIGCPEHSACWVSVSSHVSGTGEVFNHRPKP